ncbi:hypothetical protein [Sulfitobacter sp. THAF37]|uniref:hypothetical protein n=1 Tax=Sulfitobacter sp. THAF37 TaxID=2587855 RepID=UPI001268F6E9|nr:hypothetical protein [Sulfitobacter sp. THAF37]
MNFINKILFLVVSWAAPICALGAYTNWSALHGGLLGHAGWSVLMLIFCSCSTAILFRVRSVGQSWVVIPGIFPIAVTFAGLAVYFVPVVIMFIAGTLLGGASLEMISFELVCGLLTLLVIVGGWTGGFVLLK